MNTNKNYKLAITGAFGALVIVLGITRLGFISVSPTVSYTILQIPVIFAAILGGFWSGVTVGAVFGIMSLIMAAMSPSGALDPLFVNPCVSIFPRVMIGVVAWFVFNFLNKIPKMPKIVSGIVSSYFATLINTILVFATLFILYFEQISSALAGIGYISVIIMHLPSAIIEGTIGAVLVASVLGSMEIKNKGKSKLNSEE